MSIKLTAGVGFQQPIVQDSLMEPMAANEDAQNRQAFDRFVIDVMKALSSRFPVCTSSDEFHFFPQIPPDCAHWSRWDDFSQESIHAFGDQCRNWRREMDHLQAALPSKDHRTDLRLLRRVLNTLQEQLTHLAFHQNQPTFYLSIVGIGLAEAIDAGPLPLRQRLQGVPDFLAGAQKNLARVPSLFNRMGLAMAKGLSDWLQALPVEDEVTGPVRTALSRFQTWLRSNPTVEAFLPPIDVYERIAAEHIGCRVSMPELNAELGVELESVTRLLNRHAARLEPDADWRNVVAGLERSGADDPAGHYRRTIEALADHCVAKGLMPADLPLDSPVKVETIPAYMTPIRSTAAFSAIPGHPARGGTFFIVGGAGGAVPADYRLLAAHETYPGHHLLDTCRWNHHRPVRRHLEFPLFYEGWASFSEELMFATGFFSGPVDRLLMAHRRYWRALRGRVDFDIHTRRRSLDQAAAFLSAQGMAPQRARAMVARYALKPGYQLSYTVGRRRFRRLYAKYHDARKVKQFARLVLSQGEIEFDQLETFLLQGGGS